MKIETDCSGGPGNGELEARLQELVNRLKLHKYRNGYRGACPVHSSNSKNSFSMALGNEKSVILMRCFNECSYKEIYEQLSSEHPDILPLKNFDEVPEAVERVEAALSTARLIGRGKATEIDVLLAHIEIAKIARRDEYYASVREVAERAKIQDPATVSRAHCRLVKAGWLRRVRYSEGGSPAIWKLEVPERDPQATFCTQYLRTENVALRSLILSMTRSDLFRNGRGLGKTAGIIFSAISIRNPITAKDLAKLLGYKAVRPVRNTLKRLANYGLVSELDRGPHGARRWCLGPRSEHEVARELGLLGETERQRERHMGQRHAYAIVRESRQPRPLKVVVGGSVVDLSTGEVLNGDTCP
jgi:DNA-binding MarR family transcriptional regulator